MSDRSAPAAGPAATSSVRRLNWGCSYNPPPGWINSDIKDGPGIDLPCDILQGLPLESDSIDYAASIHALPEIAMPDIGRVLEELRRVLKPGGVLRLALPSLEKGIAAWQAGRRDYFLVPDSDARRPGSKLVVQLLWYGYVRTLFTEDFAIEVLENAGFRNITVCAFQQTASAFPGIVELDDRPAESLFIEATK